MKTAGIRCGADLSGDKIGGKIRNAELAKVHTMFVVGKKEFDNGTVAVRVHGHGDQGVKLIADAISGISAKIEERSL